MVNPLETRDLSVFLRNKPIIQDINWRAERGQINAIIGPNGAGKSTLLKAVMGIIEFRGASLLEGKPASTYERKERARRLAWVPQRSALQLSITVENLVAQGRFPHLGVSGQLSTHDRGCIRQALDDVNCAHLAQRKWTTLSGGERRRTMIARGLATGAKVLLLDEPTASLDIEHALRLMELMRHLADQGYTIVQVLHDLNITRRYADNVLLLDQGQRVAYGKTDDVLTKELIGGVYNVDMIENAAMEYTLRGAR